MQWVEVAGTVTLQAVDEPHQLFLGDVGVAQVEGDGLPADDAAQHGGGDGALPAQVDLSPQPLIAAPGGGRDHSFSPQGRRPWRLD